MNEVIKFNIKRASLIFLWSENIFGRDTVLEY